MSYLSTNQAAIEWTETDTGDVSASSAPEKMIDFVWLWTTKALEMGVTWGTQVF